MKEQEEYKSFVYFYESIPTKKDVRNQVADQQQVLVTTKSHTMNVDLYLGIVLHLGGDIQNEVEAHSNSKVSVHEKDDEILERDVHSNVEDERQNEETRCEPKLSKYVKIRHLAAQIIGDKDARPMK